MLILTYFLSYKTLINGGKHIRFASNRVKVQEIAQIMMFVLFSNYSVTILKFNPFSKLKFLNLRFPVFSLR